MVMLRVHISTKMVAVQHERLSWQLRLAREENGSRLEREADSAIKQTAIFASARLIPLRPS
jgi:hypothetical protein